MKNVKIITIILAIILVTMVAFGGVYIKTQNRMENKVKGYLLGGDLEGSRIVEVKVAEGDNKPAAEKLTIENYEIVKKTIETRLKDLGAPDYTISLNKENGTIIVELEEDANTDTFVYYLTASGKFQVVEKEKGTVLLTDAMLEKTTYTYTADPEGKYQVYVDLMLTEEGQAKIEEVKNNYAIFPKEIEEIEAAKEAEKKETENTTTEGEKTTETEEGTLVQKPIAKLKIANTEYDIEKIEGNEIRIKIGTETTNITNVNSYISQAGEITFLTNSGKFPIDYEIGNNRYIYTDISNTYLMYIAIAVLAIILIVFVIFVIKYKVNGLLVNFATVGFVALLTLVLRYTNVAITIEGIGAIALSIAMHIVFSGMILKKSKISGNINEAVVDTFKEFFLKLMPVILVVLVFAFSGWANLVSFGLIMFWGLMLIAIYNVLVTKTLLKLRENK